MKDKSNKVSIVIAIFAVILILGGVYLLNESFNTDQPTSIRQGSNRQAMTYSVVEDDTKDEDEGESQELFSASEEDNLEDTSLSNSNNSLNNSTSSEGSTVLENEPVINEEEKQQKDEDEAALKEAEQEQKELEESQQDEEVVTADVEDNQILVTVDSTDGFNSTVTIDSCGVPNAVACVQGETLQLRALQEYTNIEVGSQYKLTGDIREVDGFIYINTLDSVDLVN